MRQNNCQHTVTVSDMLQTHDISMEEDGQKTRKDLQTKSKQNVTKGWQVEMKAKDNNKQ